MKRKFAVMAPLAAVALTGAGVALFSVYGQASASAGAVKDKVDAGHTAVAAYTLPGGASSLNETYQDWRVVCQKGSAGAQCVVVQQVSENKTHQRVLAIEIQPRNGKTEGVMTLPFGLLLAKGASLQADGRPVGQALSYTTCFSAGCLVPVSLSKQESDQMQQAQKIEVKAVAINGQTVEIPFSNKGLEQAMARINALLTNRK